MKTQPKYAFEDRLARWRVQRDPGPVYFDEKTEKWRPPREQTAALAAVGEPAGLHNCGMTCELWISGWLSAVMPPPVDTH